MFNVQNYDFHNPKVFPINHEQVTNYNKIKLKNIVATCHPTRVLFIYEIHSGYNAFVWDIEKNIEIDNFASRENDKLLFYAQPPRDQVYESIVAADIKSQEEDYYLKKGDNNKNGSGQVNKDKKDEADETKGYFLSHTGYLVFDNYFVNLTTMIPSPFMKLDANKDTIEYRQNDTDKKRIVRNNSELWEMGPKFNFDETCLIINGYISHAYSYQDIFFRVKRMTYGIKNIQASKYFIGRRSILSDLVMDEDKLSRIFENFTRDKIMMCMMFVQDNKGNTPLEESIDNNSPKIVEMFLEYANEIQEFKLSKMFYKWFDALFDLGIESFRNFLGTCYFSTPQMAIMKKMENKGHKGIIRHGVACSMIPEDLNRKYLIDHIKSDKSKHFNDDDNLPDSQSDGPSNEESDNNDQDPDDESLISDFGPDEDTRAGNQDGDDEAKQTNIKSERRIEVKAVEFDWLFDRNYGKRFMEKLSDTEDLSYFELDIIKDIIWFQWNKFLPAIMVVLFAPFLIFFIIFILYTSWLINEKNNEDDDWGPWYTATFITAIAILVFQVFFSFVEIHQLIVHKSHYFTSFWNLLDVTSILINTTVVFMDLSDANKNDVNAVACIAVLVLWFRLFYLLRVFSETAYLISMIQAIIIEMKYFVLALVIAVLAFSNTFFILGRNAEENFTGDNIWDAFIFTYRMGLGDFDTDGFNTDDEALIWILWFINTLIILIILLNLVIAIMGDTFDRVQETQESTMLKEFTNIMRENEFLIPKRLLYKNTKLIVIVQPEKAEGGTTSNWEGKLNQLKRFLEDSSSKHIAHLKKMEKRLERMIEYGLEEKLKPTEDKVNGKIAVLELRLQKANKVFSQYPIKELLEKVLHYQSN